MARVLYEGVYQIIENVLMYILNPVNGGSKVVLKNGDEYKVGCVTFRIRERLDEATGQRRLVASSYNKVKKRQTSLELPDKEIVCLATTSKAAYNGLIRIYRPLDTQDKLTRCLQEIGFIPQCMSLVNELERSEIEIKPNAVDGCYQYTVGKNQYEYEFVTDATEKDVCSAVQPQCVGCNASRARKGNPCPNALKTRYIKLHDGSFYFITRRNLRSGEKQILKLVMEVDADRNLIADKIEEVFGLR